MENVSDFLLDKSDYIYGNSIYVNNVTGCPPLLDPAVWSDVGLVSSLLVLLAINVVVIVGNCLVILAVFLSHKLRSVTNLFIVSLAAADLMVGLAVLPFSATWEVFQVWLFGEVWCAIWLAMDVWMCTASILNLCAISLDRYVAVTRPIAYPSIMSSSRAKALIAGVWALSFLICFPPLVGWSDHSMDLFFFAPRSATSGVEKCTFTCELTNDKGYVVYSALGSFYIPMLVMLFFYWRIYRAAVETTRAINQGFRTTKGAQGSRLMGGAGARFQEQRLTLRIHRGRSVMHHANGGSPHHTRSNSSRGVNGGLTRSRSADRITINVSEADPSPHLTPSPPTPALYAVKYMGRSRKHRHERVGDPSKLRLGVGMGHTRDSELCTPSPSPTAAYRSISNYDSISSSSEENKPRLISKMGKRNIKAQVKRFKMETKAAKTLGIIVGGFIVCWLPFFSMYVIRAFCPDCIPPLLFSVLFWLGYCNSALNPCIYALFSRDFRFAFKKLLCRCSCTKYGGPPSSPVHVPNIGMNSLGDDSEGNDLHASDSR